MFYNCGSLTSLSFNKEDEKSLHIPKYIIDIYCKFPNCNSLISFLDISKWETFKINNMNGMFYGCKSLQSLPDLSKLNISNVINMSDMFNGCISLKSLPDLSKWNTSNVINMSKMFYRCIIII